MSEDKDFTEKDRRAGSSEAQGQGCGGQAAGGVMPKVTFSTFILSLSSTALVSLGEAPDPDSGQFNENLALAKHTIDTLVMLKNKTERCLDPDEAQLLDGILYELRMKFVMKAR